MNEGESSSSSELGQQTEFSKAGYSWALGLLMLVPIANIIMPFVLAFGDWPIYKELRLLRQQQNSTTG